MKCVLLAAGYATRLYPLTLNLPKSLLPVAGRTILDRILEKVDAVDAVDEVILVSNSRFAAQFGDFLSARKSRVPPFLTTVRTTMIRGWGRSPTSCSPSTN